VVSDNIQGEEMLDYGIVGNCITCALVKKDTSLDWMCFPNFSSPSVFGRILDRKKGGTFRIVPLGKYKVSQQYIPCTAILETRFDGRGKAFVVYDFFPRYKKLLAGKQEKLIKINSFVRIVKPLRGKPKIRVIYEPRPDYAMDECELREREGRFVCGKNSDSVTLASNVPLESIKDSKEITLDHTRYFVIGGDGSRQYSVKKCSKLLTDTRKYWLGWCGTLILPEENREMIIRSAITLKLLTYSATGAIIAAPTTSITEEVGTDRTFDYRICFVRDAAFCVDALKKIGRDYEPKSLMGFILNRILSDDHIQPLYGINGETKLTERELNHLSGFMDSGPVRVGNAAYKQRQNDIYGEIIDILYLYFVYYEYEKEMSKKYWRFLRYVVNQIKFNWHRKDSSIWEYRDLEDHYTYSKFMCYVGVDRAMKIAQHFDRDELVNEWLPLKDEIVEDFLKHGYDKELNSFTIAYGKKHLDSSHLLMAYHEFLGRDEPRLVNTIKAIYRNLRKGYMVQRYTMEDDFGKSGIALTICTFWLIDALYYIGEEKKARQLFRKIVKKANHLGLFSESLDTKTGRMLGNFPQGYTHIGLINTSILLSEWSSKRKKIDWSIFPKRKKWF
jgi:GH15 family glucan-1,4-alpha-glucosidase